jgi:hypothetical protein
MLFSLNTGKSSAMGRYNLLRALVEHGWDIRCAARRVRRGAFSGVAVCHLGIFARRAGARASPTSLDSDGRQRLQRISEVRRPKSH